MRPIIDLNNLWYSEETVVYVSRFNIVFRVILLIALFIFSIYLVIIKEDLSSIVVFIVMCFLIIKCKKYILEWNVVQFRINSDGIKIKNDPIISWNDIENDRIIEVKYDQGINYEFAFYDANNHRPLRYQIENLNIGHQDLIGSAKIHRERFNRKNNPNQS